MVKVLRQLQCSLGGSFVWSPVFFFFMMSVPCSKPRNPSIGSRKPGYLFHPRPSTLTPRPSPLTPRPSPLTPHPTPLPLPLSPLPSPLFFAPLNSILTTFYITRLSSISFEEHEVNIKRVLGTGGYSIVYSGELQ